MTRVGGGRRPARRSRPCGLAAAAACLIAATSIPAAAATLADPYPRAAAAYGVVIDGQLAWGRELDTPHPPASLAKLLAALVLLEDGWDPAADVRVSAAAAGVEGSRAGLRAGEVLSADDALTALLVRSANDACVALVERFGGSMRRFVDAMNARAARLGMRDSRFGNACGLDAPGQVTTVRDLLRLGAAAMAEPAIARRAAMAEARVQTRSGRVIPLRSSNALLGRSKGVIGLKSGFTSRAGRCLVAVAVRDSHHVWVVMLNAPDRWWVSAGIIEEAFDVAMGLAP
jgi:D-alanyl-D-alanine carboxypeptidase (penicillin-binding protein 5/6)